ncbi:uncharacterized protein LOC111714277 isoform X2 [Eurytemora carolleeae]|uniref:uncharacterized protein LOC111714277 isoform X2 n=1 Tax=Eurytemora carolleeae TaxID=1294199 RepID=UPI000C756F8A|nr:uncharacterized protein LOC111714277 isoform X2 [Eurytemora carolleeae]|eukprot:XP_023345111.1 uncharacterized protein LOC111714277 isoform X2 [Eurytemora affinis]
MLVVGGLTNGHIGSMIQPLELTKNQRRKKRRKEGRITSEHLKNVEEEMESEDDVYMTFSGRKGEQLILSTVQGEQLITENLKRSNSWGQSCDEINQLNQKKSRAEEEEEEEEEDDGYAEEFSKSKVWEKHVSDVIKSTRFLVSQVAGETERRDNRFCKSRSTSSVHDVDTDLESETRLAGLTPTAVARKIQRSKSTSPSRQASQMKRQKVLFKNFRPEEADWLQ